MYLAADVVNTFLLFTPPIYFSFPALALSRHCPSLAFRFPASFSHRAQPRCQNYRKPSRQKGPKKIILVPGRSGFPGSLFFASIFKSLPAHQLFTNVSTPICNQEQQHAAQPPLLTTPNATMAVLDYVAPAFLFVCVVTFAAVAGEDIWSGWLAKGEAAASTPRNLSSGAAVASVKTATAAPATHVHQRPALPGERQQPAALLPPGAQTKAPGAGDAAWASWGEVRLADGKHGFAMHFSREEVYNPATALLDDGTLWLYVRFEGRNSTATWTQCPESSLYTLRPCPVQDLRMVSFVVRCQLNAALTCR